MDQEGSKHVVVSGFYDIIVNLIQFCAFVGLNWGKLTFICYLDELQVSKRCNRMVRILTGISGRHISDGLSPQDTTSAFLAYDSVVQESS